MDDAGRRDLPTDVLVEILLRLPPSTRRRVRLVCRLWRDVIDEHTTEMQSRATTLLWNTSEAVAYVVDVDGGIHKAVESGQSRPDFLQ